MLSKFLQRPIVATQIMSSSALAARSLIPIRPHIRNFMRMNNAAMYRPTPPPTSLKNKVFS